VAREITLFRREWRVRRLRLYRKHLQVTVCQATPLLAMIARDQGVEVRAELMRLRPPPGWPHAARPRGTIASISQLLGHQQIGAGYGLGPPDPFRTVLVRDRQDPRGALMLRVADGTLELTTMVNEASIRTDGGQVLLGLPFHLPDTIDAAAVGRPASCLVGHPWFTNPDWTIDSVERGDTHTFVRIRTGYEPFSMPWRHLLGRGRRS
jgi:hypothetical protein